MKKRTDTSSEKNPNGNGTFPISNGMKQLQMKIDPKKKGLKDSVLSRIENENICPKGKWVCHCRDWGVWAFWVVTVIVGAIAFAETAYISMHSGIEIYDATHASLLSFVLDALPFVWLLAFIGVVVLAYYNMRKTKRGYRYPLWRIIGSSVLFTVVGGLLLHYAGVSMVVDRMMHDRMPGYLSNEARQQYLWEHPELGRITGMFVVHSTETATARFKDTLDREWMVTTHELPPKDLVLLHSGDQVRLLGEAVTSTVTNRFYACGVLPWMPKHNTIMGIRETRRTVEEKLMRYVPENEGVPPQPSLRCREVMKAVFHRNY